MAHEKKLLYSNINYGPPDLRTYWDEVAQKSTEELQFHIQVARRFGKNRFIARLGKWDTPWPMQLTPGFEMPTKQKNFSKSFAEVTNERSQSIRKTIETTGARIAIFYSGGIDSTICMTSLIQNLNPQELAQVDVCMSTESLIENPSFYQKFIHGKFNILDSSKVSYSDIEQAGNFAITSDQGDSIFGTELATEFYLLHPHLNPEESFHRHQEKIVNFFNLKDSARFGAIFFERLLENINTAKAEIYSVHDLFWWIIFNLKYMDCALRGPVFYYVDSANRERAVQTTIINWFHTHEYQQWSLANNNNGQKILGNSLTTYKWAGRQFIYDFDKSDWQFRHKLKISSLINISHRSPHRMVAKNIFGLDTDYNVIYLGSDRSNLFIQSSLS